MSLFFFTDCLGRAWERKRTLLILGGTVLLGFILGISFAQTPAFYEFHVKGCERFLVRVCYSDRSIFEIFLERTAGCALLLLLMLTAGMHYAGCILPPVLLVFRSYTLGGSVAIFFTVYGVSGALIVFVLLLPFHLLIDAVLLLASAISYGRMGRFCFAKQDFFELALDFLALFLLILAVCLLEALILLAVFHPIGNV